MADPILSTPPAFTLLAVMVGLAAYLRNLAETRDKMADDIEEKRIQRFPPGAPHTKTKLAELKSSRRRLNAVAPVMIWMTIFTAIRLALVAAVRLFYRLDPTRWDGYFYWYDFVVMCMVVLLFIALWIMHFVTRRRDDRMRAIVEALRASEDSKRAAHV
jgi:hypothetical protein